MNVGAVLRATARRLPHKKAVTYGSRSFTFGDLDRAADQVASFLSSRGVKKGERVGIIFPNIPEFVLVYLGIARLGAVTVPLDARLKRDELGPILRDSEIQAVFVTESVYLEEGRECAEMKALSTTVVAGGTFPGTFSLQAVLDDKGLPPLNPVQIAEEDEALYLYTSGTTGRPKAVVLSFRNLDYFPLTMNTMVHAGQDDVIGFILPVSHISGPVVTNEVVTNGSTMAIFEHLRPDKILEEVQRQGVTYFFGVPPIFQALLRVPHRERFHLKSLVYVAMMGTSVPVQLLRDFREAFPTVKVIQGYGLTETSPYITLLPLEHAERKMGSIGLPVPEIEIRLVDGNAGSDATPQVGEIVVRGPMVMKGYHNNPSATAERIRNGWLYTGDLGRVDEEGFYYHLGRKDDMIITGGLNVFPAEVENVLLRHPDIVEAGVVGVPDQDRGQVIKAVVVARPGATPEKKELLSFCREHLANFKVPKQIELRDSLPKTATGKVARRELL